MDVPLALNSIKAGFPSPADDFVENYLDLNKYLIRRPSSTFLVRVSGDSMVNAGILDGSILVVDKSTEYFNDSIVIAVVDNEFTVKRLKYINNQSYLYPENPNYKSIKLKISDYVWGVVTACITKF